MSKYEPLTAFLAGRTSTEVPMTFAEIEKVIGAPLPPSKQYPAWWSNNPSNNVMTKAWLAAGFQTERVDIGSERLVFRRVGGHAAKSAPDGRGGLVARLQARLGGTVRIQPDVDVTRPSGEPWDAQS